MENSSAKIFPVNTVVVAMYGATAGQVGILRISATTNQAVCGILPSDSYSSEFMYYQLVSLKEEMVSQAQGGAQPNISQIKIKNLEIILPPLSVQKGIVAKLDAAKERCEKLKAEAERGLKAAENLRKAILSEAFE
jgi:type I restriction enzyme S subunit